MHSESLETNHLLHSVNSSPFHQGRLICNLKHLCLPSKSAILILLWTAIVGLIYHTIITLFTISVESIRHPQPLIFDLLPYALKAVVMMFYLLSGFTADVCCGRLRMTVISLILLLISNFFSVSRSIGDSNHYACNS